MPRVEVGVQRTWRPPAWERIAGAIISLAFLVIAVSILATGGIHQKLAYLAECAFFLVASILIALYVAATSLTIKKDVITVSNFGHRRDVSLRDITSLHPGYYGTEIHYRNGGWWISIAVQKARISTWLGKKTRADEIAEAVMSAARSAREEY